MNKQELIKLRETLSDVPHGISSQGLKLFQTKRELLTFAITKMDQLEQAQKCVDQVIKEVNMLVLSN